MKFKKNKQEPSRKIEQENKYSIFSIVWLGFEIAIIGVIIGNFAGELKGACIVGILGGILGLAIGVMAKWRNK